MIFPIACTLLALGIFLWWGIDCMRHMVRIETRKDKERRELQERVTALEVEQAALRKLIEDNDRLNPYRTKTNHSNPSNAYDHEGRLAKVSKRTDAAMGTMIDLVNKRS